MEEKLKIDTELCTACRQCQQVCIRDNICVDDFAVEIEATALNAAIAWQYADRVQLPLNPLKEKKVGLQITILVKVFSNMMI